VSGNVKVIVRVRVLSYMPPGEFEGQGTRFGLQNRNRMLHPGKPAGKDLVAFDVGIPLLAGPGTSPPRFRGFFVFDGPQDRQHLCLCLRRRTPSEEAADIARQRIPLDMSRAQISSAISSGCLLEADCTWIMWDRPADLGAPRAGNSSWVIRRPD